MCKHGVAFCLIYQKHPRKCQLHKNKKTRQIALFGIFQLTVFDTASASFLQWQKTEKWIYLRPSLGE